MLKTPLAHLKLAGIGPRSLESLGQASIKNLGDLLLHVPLRYQKKILLSTCADFKEDESFYLEVLLVAIERQGRVTKLHVQDSSGQTFTLAFFHFSIWHQRRYTVGIRLRVFGVVKSFQGRWEISHPDLEIVSKQAVFEPSITCLYPKIGNITSKALTKSLTSLWTKNNFAHQREQEVFEAFRILHAIALSDEEFEHFDDLLSKAKEKLAFLEAVHYFFSLEKKEQDLEDKAPPLSPGGLFSTLRSALPFTLTKGQEEILAALLENFRQGIRQPCLIQGDVGSGKTILAFFALACAYDSGKQGVLMAPTELLARQHYQQLLKLLPGFSESFLYLSGTVKAKEKKRVQQRLAENKPLIVIGTHALFQDKLLFSDLQLVVIDEQQRFGVGQREKLLEKSWQSQSYQLTLSATPIPRTLAMATYGPINLYALKEKPEGRKDILTYTISQKNIDTVYRSIRNCINKGQQCYWICPLISQSESLDCQDVERAFQRLTAQFSDLNVACIHGQVPIEKREALLNDFKEGRIDLLVSTLVIEVGVDNPKASLMVIESPERLGLAQLHQLRGRVGRGHYQGYCLLVYDKELAANSVERLQALCQSQDGFYLSEVDLQLRGPGEALGKKQSGQVQFRFFDIVSGESLLPQVLAYCRDCSTEQKNLLTDLFGQVEEGIYA